MAALERCQREAGKGRGSVGKVGKSEADVRSLFLRAVKAADIIDVAL